MLHPFQHGSHFDKGIYSINLGAWKKLLEEVAFNKRPVKIGGKTHLRLSSSEISPIHLLVSFFLFCYNVWSSIRVCIVPQILWGINERFHKKIIHCGSRYSRKNSPFLIKCLQKGKNYSPADLTIHETYKTNHYKWKNLSNTA